jgi:hypothetical protein
MRRLLCVFGLFLMAIPAWPAKQITIAELTDMLNSMRQAKKSDADTADALKQVVLSEEMNRATMNQLAEFVPGPATTEQVYVLEVRSAMLAPPAADIPSTPAPDAAAQKTILDKTADYASKMYAQLPAVTAAKTTQRFQDNVEAVAPSSGMHGGAKDVSVGSSFVSPYQYVRYINATEGTYSSERGLEKLAQDKTPWGANSMTAIMEPDPSVATVFQEAQANGAITWLRWQTIGGKPAGVFSFQVPKKKSHMALNICCFPNLNQTGDARFSGQNGAGLPGGSAGAGGGAKGNFQTNTDWHPYKQNGVGYHGEFYVDPETGIVVRMIVIAELKPNEIVHAQATRIDYGPETIGGKPMILPVRTIVATEVVPSGDSQAGKYSVRNTYLSTEYKDYQLAGATASK